jgi:DNA-binding LytR/AlgR family response regulator
MKNKLNNLIGILNEELGLFLSITFGVFLFILFFQPFSLEHFDFNYRLIFVAGLGGIVFFVMFLVRTLYTWLISNKSTYRDADMPSYMSGFFIFLFCSVGFSFYLHYVGSISYSFYLAVKVVIICIAPSVILGINDKIKELKQLNESLVSEKKDIQKQIEKYEDDYLNKSIDFISENNAEHLSLLIGEVVFIKSADNYVEIVYMEGNNFKKKLIRNTLKNIEFQIKQYTNFIRSHRICIVNTHYIEKLVIAFNSHSLLIKGYDEHLPVSRQYLIKVKEAI